MQEQLSNYNKTQKALEFLKSLIKIPSFSKEEAETATFIASFLTNENIEINQHLNNVWAVNKYFDKTKPSILLNSHHDTVKPSQSYTRDPFNPEIIDGKLYGLGSNDAGGPLVSLLMVFIHFYNSNNLPYNLIFAATAEEENSGDNGIQSILPFFENIEFAVVGEPTSMEMSVAEKGILVLDCTAHGKSGHAARNVGINAIYQALPDIEWIKTFKHEKTSEWLGEVKQTVTVINAGQLHNVIPDTCTFTVDVRITEQYTHEEILNTFRKNLKSTVTPRSFKLRSSKIDVNHPFVQCAKNLNIKLFGSPTTSDRAVIPYPSVKIGPGDSNRSHTANEFIFVKELEDGIDVLLQLFTTFLSK